MRMRGRVGRALTTALALAELRPRRRRHRMDGRGVGGDHCLQLQVHRGGERPKGVQVAEERKRHTGREDVQAYA